MFSYIHNVGHIEAYLPTFGYISADSGIFRILTELEMFMYIKAYSESLAYSGILRTANIFSQLQSRYSGITQKQFMHTLNLVEADSDIFRTLVYLGT